MGSRAAALGLVAAVLSAAGCKAPFALGGSPFDLDGWAEMLRPARPEGGRGTPTMTGDAVVLAEAGTPPAQDRASRAGFWSTAPEAASATPTATSPADAVPASATQAAATGPELPDPVTVPEAQPEEKAPAQAPPPAPAKLPVPEKLPAPTPKGPAAAAPPAAALGSAIPAGPRAKLTLDRLISLTLQANPDLQSALARTHLAEATLARANAEFYPLLSWNENYQASNNLLNKFQFYLLQQEHNANVLFNVPHLDQGNLRGQIEHTTQNVFNFPTGMVDNLQTQLQVQETIYNGGLRLARSRAAEADAEAARYGLTAVQNRLVFNVAEAYYRLYQANALLQVRRETVRQVESQLETVQSRIRAQTATRSELFQVEVRLSEVREALITARNQVELSWAVLENLVGARLEGLGLPATLPPAPWSDHAQVTEAAVDQVLENAESADGAEVEAAVATALGQRPELAQGESQRRAAEHRVRAAQASKYGSLSAVADYDHYNGRSPSSSDTFFTGLAFSLNLFDGCRTRSAVRQAQAQVHEIIAANRRTQLDIELDVRRAFLALKDARERLKVTTSAVRDAEENMRSKESLFANQTATLTELLNAQVALTDARVRDTRARAEVEIARAELERAVGRLSRFLAPCTAHACP
jgi:outer membrane protein TolC